MRRIVSLKGTEFILYALLLGVPTQSFFAVFPALMLYLIDYVMQAENNTEEKELSYRDILIFSSKKELLEFLKSGVYKNPQENLSLDLKRTLALTLLAVFFSLIFAYAYSNVYALLSLLTLPLFVRRMP